MSRWPVLLLGVAGLLGVGVVAIHRSRSPGATSARAGGPHRIVALGDSITFDGRYLDSLLTKLPVGSQGWKVAKGGAGVKYIRENLLPEALAHNPTDLIVLAGVNDLASNRAPAAIAGHLDAIYREAQARGIRVIAVTVLPWEGHLQKPKFAPHRDEIRAKQVEVNRWIRSQAPRVAVVDGDVLGSNGMLHQGFTRDGIHPVGLGHDALGQLIFTSVGW